MPDLDYRALLDQARDVIAVFDHELRYVYLNDAITAIWGGVPDDYIGKVIGEHDRLDTRAWREAILEVARTGEPRTLDMTFPSKTGPRRLASVFTAFTSELVCAVTRDISDLYAAQLLDAAAHTMRNGLAIIDAAAREIVFANDEFNRVLRLEKQRHLEGYDDTLVFAEDGQPVPREQWPARRALLGETVLNSMLRIRPSEGRDIWLAASAAPVRNDAGQVVAAVCTQIEMTAQKRSEEQARLLADIGVCLEQFDERETLAAVAERLVPALGDWSYIHLAGARPDHPRLVAVAGSDADQVTAARARIGSESPMSRQTPLVRVLEGGPPEMLDLDADGLQRIELDPELLAAIETRGHRSIMVAPITSRRGVVGALTVASTRDRWNYDRAELALLVELARRTGNALENARLTDELREQKGQLELAIAQAREANRRKDEFLAMLGHELRNPLAPIATALELMELKNTGGFEKERAVIGRQVTHLSRLIDDLLDVSRITRGTIGLQRQPVELGSVIARAIEMASPLLEKRMQPLSIEVPATGLLVDADITRLAQVFQNVLMNAAKYSPDHAPIAIAARREGHQLVIDVIDRGIGIGPDLLPNLFDLFVQGKQGIDRSIGGLGIGLSIAKSLCELHGGTITAASTGAGSTFTVRLPASTAAADPARDPAAGPARAVGAGRRVLIVDDNVDAAHLLSELVSAQGFEVAIAHDAVRALALAHSFEPEIGLLDIGLPVIDGYDLARQLRERRAGRELRLIAITGYGQEADRERSRLAGFDAHLTKPVAYDALHGVLL